MHFSAVKVQIAPSPDALEWSELSNIPRSVISYNLKRPRVMCDAPFARNWCNSAYSIRSSVATPVMHLSVVSWRGSSTSKVWKPAALRAVKGKLDVPKWQIVKFTHARSWLIVTKFLPFVSLYYTFRLGATVHNIVSSSHGSDEMAPKRMRFNDVPQQSSSNMINFETLANAHRQQMVTDEWTRMMSSILIK